VTPWSNDSSSGTRMIGRTANGGNVASAKALRLSQIGSGYVRRKWVSACGRCACRGARIDPTIDQGRLASPSRAVTHGFTTGSRRSFYQKSAGDLTPVEAAKSFIYRMISTSRTQALNIATSMERITPAANAVIVPGSTPQSAKPAHMPGNVAIWKSTARRTACVAR
jgi:hypothetical protein